MVSSLIRTARDRNYGVVLGITGIFRFSFLFFALPATAQEKLLVFAGAASKPPTEDAAALYEKKTGTNVELIFGGSGYVLSQMKLAKLTMKNGTPKCLNLDSGDNVIVGIRSEFVALHCNGLIDSSDNLRLRGSVVEISDTIHGAIISFRPKGKDALVKITIEAHEAATLGQAEIEISMPSQHLFCIPLKNAYQQSTLTRGSWPSARR